MEISHLDHLVITTTDLKASLHFYGDILNMQVVGDGQRWAVKFGDQKFNLHTRPAEFLPAAKAPTPGSADLCLIAKGKIEDIREELIAKGVVIEEGIVPRTGAQGAIRSVYIRDPDGNLVEISTYC